MATYLSSDITAMRRKPDPPTNSTAKACRKQAAKEIVCLPRRKMTRSLGMTALVTQHSRKEKILREKYMGVLRRAPAQTVAMMTVFPVVEQVCQQVH